MKIGLLGSGDVATSLAVGFLRHGPAVVLGTRSPAKLDDWLAKHREARVGSFADAAAFADVVVLSVKGTAAPDVLRAAGTANLEGKVVIDTTNPISDDAPENGVLRFFTTPNDSL